MEIGKPIEAVPVPEPETAPIPDKEKESINMSYVSLLGDSIIDNKVYVHPGELSVKEHLEDQSDMFLIN